MLEAEQLTLSRLYYQVGHLYNSVSIMFYQHREVVQRRGDIESPNCPEVVY